LGYCVESEVVGRSGPFKIVVVLDKQLIVKQAAVVSYPWPRGRDVARRAFTSQFEGKGPEDAIEIGKDIDAMSGATISCRAMSEGVREAIKILNGIKASQAAKPSKRL
jgi:Na+-translocating ferredoxin:NAD+ oxidoreductase RnfG subunit